MMDRRQDVRGLVVGEIRSGQVLPGSQILIARLADRLRISPIPVREALSRLAGEGLLSERSGAGFFVPRLHAHQLAELYRLRLLVITAVTTAVTRTIPEAGTGRAIGPWHAIDPLLDGIVAGAGDTALATVWAYSDHRLLPYRRYEAAPDAIERTGLRDLLEAATVQDAAQLRRVAGQHLRRRIQRCEEMIRRAAADNIDKILSL